MAEHQPVLVDTEALFHPALAAPVDSIDPAGRMLADTVRTPPQTEMPCSA